MTRPAILAIVLLIAALSGALAALAQEGTGGRIDPHRDCQTIVTCNYRKGGSYRGCLSSYSCRVCRFVTARCAIPGSSNRVCQRMRCSWG